MTVGAFVVLQVGTMGLWPSAGVLGLLTVPSSARQLVRILMPVVLVAPLLLGWVVNYGVPAGWIDASESFALTWGVASLVLTGLVVRQGLVLRRADRERERAAREREAIIADLERAWDQIGAINVDLSRQAAALERSNRELLQFAYVASHDLQAPLRSIAGFVQLLQDEYGERLDAQAQDWIRRTVASARHLDTLIRDILAYSGIESRARPFTTTPLADVFDGVVTILSSSIHDAGARVTRDDLPVVVGDPSQLAQLLQNLLSNALKYQGEDPPRVHVSAEQRGNDWVVAMRDNGIGIAPQHQDRIFQIFQRLHNQREYPGTGIGLTICRRVVERHGGRLWVSSQPGVGSTFYFTLPQAMADTSALDAGVGA